MTRTNPKSFMTTPIVESVGEYGKIFPGDLLLFFYALNRTSLRRQILSMKMKLLGDPLPCCALRRRILEERFCILGPYTSDRTGIRTDSGLAPSLYA